MPSHLRNGKDILLKEQQRVLRALKTHYSSMSMQQKDPTLDFLEKQFPKTQSQLMMDMNDLFGLGKILNQDKGLSLPPKGSPAASRTAVSNSTTPAPQPIEKENPLPHSSLSPTETETSLGPSTAKGVVLVTTPRGNTDVTSVAATDLAAGGCNQYNPFGGEEPLWTFAPQTPDHPKK
ncbi:hypothetical protein PCASD_16292 [Puccinia coronata f. sp. avenae]|uniref:Uncharacterized protein n=1 Tax=Puccinia coronata f. sp. avenae TaxID=200324 RepID=A0A2N5UE82_9BASI|nr:hypothetical protein PCASD_16292 [Puccinia coronata f. sp. avenae]